MSFYTLCVVVALIQQVRELMSKVDKAGVNSGLSFVSFIDTVNKVGYVYGMRISSIHTVVHSVC